MAQNGKLISKTNLEAKASSKLISLADARANKAIKISASTEFIAQIAVQLGMTECISVYADRAYIADATVIAINELLG
jgi:lactam utilization protein B